MRFLTLALFLLLNGCSSNQVTTYYQLPLPLVMNSQINELAKTVYIEPIQVASYLNGRGLVLQISDVELIVARQHVWAEALDQQLQRQLRNRLQALAPEYMTVLQPLPETVRITVQLEQFHGDADGQAIVSGRFAISNRERAVPFVIREPLTDNGYPALVIALADAVQQLSQQIAQYLVNDR